MGPIPEEIAGKTWEEVVGFSPDRAKKEMMKLGNNQPDVLAFVAESVKEMGQEMRDLAIYMFFVVYRKKTKICSSSTLEKTARRLAAFHRPLKVDFSAKFGLPLEKGKVKGRR
jgi:hypothetical protein